MKIDIQAEEKEPFRKQPIYTGKHESKRQEYIQAVQSTEYIMKMKGRVTGFIAMILTALYALYICSYFSSVGMDSIGGYFAMQIVMPHMICVVVATIFVCIGFFGKKRWAMLTAGILLAVSAVLMMTYAPMVIVQAVLCFVSYARMGKYTEVQVL